MTELLKKDTVDGKPPTFEESKKAFLTEIIVDYPDFNRPFFLNTDASTAAIGGEWFQIRDDNQHATIRSVSRVLKPAETRYTMTEQETLEYSAKLRKKLSSITKKQDNDERIAKVKRGAIEKEYEQIFSHKPGLVRGYKQRRSIRTTKSIFQRLWAVQPTKWLQCFNQTENCINRLRSKVTKMALGQMVEGILQKQPTVKEVKFQKNQQLPTNTEEWETIIQEKFE